MIMWVVGAIKNQEIKGEQLATKIYVCDVQMHFRLDTESDANFLSLNMLKLIQPMHERRKSSIIMRVSNGRKIPSIG